MSVSYFITQLLRSLIPVAAGYILARWLGFSGRALQVLLRYVLFPVFLFIFLLVGPIHQRTFMILVGTGVAMALVGYWLVLLAPRLFKAEVGLAAARPNIAAFVLPFMFLSWQFRSGGVIAAVVLFLAVALTLMFCELGENGFKAMIREPWLYAAILALVFRLGGIPKSAVLKIVGPLGDGTWVVMLLFLGAMLHPISGFKSKEVWLGVIIRLATGLLVGLLAVWILPMPSLVDRAVILTALAPASTPALSLIRKGDDQQDSHAMVTVSFFVSLAAMLVWRIFFFK